MPSLADRTIAALQANHDTLRHWVNGLSDEQLLLPSGSSEWDVAQVLSHLGSGAEIAEAGLRATLAGDPPLSPDFNQGVWDRWNQLGPRAKVNEFIENDARIQATYQELDVQTRENLTVQLGFLPFPLTLTAVLGMRLNEAAQHSWDVRVALDPAATLASDAAELLLEHFAGDIGFLLGFTAKADAAAGRVALALGESGYGLLVDETVSLTSSLVDPTGVMHGQPETAVRLLGGRLTPEHTPAAVSVSGNTSLEELRRVFPGY